MKALVPYITTWSTEKLIPTTVVAHPRSGIAFADETLGDRDERGVLWQRRPSQPGSGRPLFGQVHPLRQRRAMRRLLCQVCGGPADHTDRGVLWVLKDHRDDWPNWPEQMAVTEPPICVPCVRTSTRHCPALRKGNVTVRVRHSTVSGVYGTYYHPGKPFPSQTASTILTFDDPAIRWICAGQLVRGLFDCTIVTPETLADPGS